MFSGWSNQKRDPLIFEDLSFEDSPGRLDSIAARWRRCATLAALFSIASLLILFSAAPLPAQSSGFAIELGDAVVLPGQTEVLLPVWITSETDLISWQMGLDYDDLLIQLIDIEFGGTESEPLNPTVQWDPLAAPYQGFEVIYPLTSPFPTGLHRLAAFLRFEVVDPTLIPPGGSIDTEVTIVDTEPYPIRFTDTGGNTTIPDAAGGTFSLTNPPLLRLGELDSGFLESDVLDDGTSSAGQLRCSTARSF
jgi:hypothetical protein